jgi:hypothetical protein
MNETEMKAWLMENGGAAICYRTATELLPDADGADINALKRDLLNSPMTQLWLSRIGLPGGLFSFHGSQPGAFENACLKLSDLGIQAGTPVLDDKTAAFRQDFADRSEYTGKFIVAGALTRVGYGTEPALYEFLLQRLDTLYAMAKTKNYDIYIDQDTYGDFPSAFRKRPLLNRAYNGMLPSIYDMLAFAYWPPSLKKADDQHKIDTIVDYVLHPDYQAFDEGYGVMRDGPRRYWSIGWSVHLPGYGSFEAMPAGRAKYFVQRVDMMARFPNAHHHRWFSDSIAHLDGFRQADGTYRFPGRYLRESQHGYWVTGAYPRLDENRSQSISLSVESTFRMLRIQRYVDDAQQAG